MRNMVCVMVLIFGLSCGTADAQDRGGRSGRASRAPQREDGPPGFPGQGGMRPPSFPIVSNLDTNGDGILDSDEIAKAAEVLRKLDRNGDGKLTEDEYLPFPPGRPGAFEEQENQRGDAPDGRRRSARGVRGGPPNAEAGARPSDFESSPLAKDDAEQKILDVLEDMNKAGRNMMSVPHDDGRFLRMLAESVAPENVVEIGTSQGYSAIWLCLALRTFGGKLTTFEVDAERAALARKNFKRAGVESLVTLIEGDAHEEIGKLKDPIDLLFIDADKEGYRDYLEKLLPLLRPGGLIVAHNMNLQQADPRYVKAITTNPKLETLFIHVGQSGIGMTLKKR
ncbi:MAG: hypothetical protein GXY44_12895 [Phycisphaerales bacterium]|nr:hypothetical protein [Phycisphaerales bacterium]